MDAESLWLCQMDDAEKQIQPLREGVLKVKSWVLFTHCYQVCVKLLLHCPNQIRPREGSLRELLRALHVPSTFWGLLWGACNGTLCMWIPQGGGETWTNPHCCFSVPGAFLSPTSPFAGGMNTGYNLSHCASKSLLGLCGALWMCSVWAKG